MKLKHYFCMITKMHSGASPKLFGYAKSMRKNMTPAEKTVWKRLRGRKLKGIKFRRQHPVGRYILDFYCQKSRLAIEVDGGIHLNKVQREYDIKRDEELRQEGITVLRFKNEEVYSNIEEVLNRIYHYAK